MRINKEKLGLRLYTDVRKEFPQTTLEDDCIVVRVGDVEIRITMASILAEIKNENVSYTKVLTNYKEILKEMIKENKFQVDYFKIFPVVRSSNFALKEPVGLYREKLFLDLDLLYVTDYSAVMRFLTVVDKFSKRKISESGRFNINKVKNELVRLHNLLEIYTTKFDSDYNCSLIFNSSFVREIKKKVGSNYLMAIPSSSTIFIAKDFEENIGFIKELMKSDEDPNYVSSHVYRYKNGEYSYAD